MRGKRERGKGNELDQNLKAKAHNCQDADETRWDCLIQPQRSGLKSVVTTLMFLAGQVPGGLVFLLTTQVPSLGEHGQLNIDDPDQDWSSSYILLVEWGQGPLPQY